jgi:type II secretory ATPase GspE/PulE/Tfp pilus assembly ATPase PilB-like protein
VDLYDEELRKVLRSKGYLSQRQKALLLAMEGVISLEEALRWTLV